MVWGDFIADESWMTLKEPAKLQDAKIESYGMYLRTRGKYLIISRSKVTDPKDDLLEGTLITPIKIIKPV